jgi:hypothetical protein
MTTTAPETQPNPLMRILQMMNGFWMMAVLSCFLGESV